MRDLMVSDPVVVSADLSLGQFMDDVVSAHRYTTYPVVEHDCAVGLLPFRSVANVPRSDWDRRTVRESMLPLDQVPGLDPVDELADALAALGESDIRRGLVLEGGRLVGLLSITDVVRALEIPRRRLAGV